MSSQSYPSDAERQVITEAEKLMALTMARYDVSHDASHIQRVRKMALRLARSTRPQPDLLVVELAALLHDITDKKYVSIDPQTVLMPFFSDIRCHLDLIKDGRAKLVIKIVENVSWTTEKNLRAGGNWTEWHDTCPELHCVQDADRLDAIGAVGVLRCAAFSCATNRVLCAEKSDPIYPETSVAHFYDKLLFIKDRLKTDLGRQLGQERHEFMVQFVTALENEVA